MKNWDTEKYENPKIWKYWKYENLKNMKFWKYENMKIWKTWKYDNTCKIWKTWKRRRANTDTSKHQYKHQHPHRHHRTSPSACFRHPGWFGAQIPEGLLFQSRSPDESACCPVVSGCQRIYSECWILPRQKASLVDTYVLERFESPAQLGTILA